MKSTPLKGRKFILKISSLIPSDAKGIYKVLESVYDIYYVGIYNVLDNICICIHTKNVVSGKKLSDIIRSLDMEVSDIQKCRTFSGEMISEHGKKFINGKRYVDPKYSKSSGISPGPTNINNNIDNSTTNNNITNNNNIDNSTTNNNINLIVVNPIGQESLDHITPEFIQELLAEHHGPDVVFRFGTKMYSLQENMNFKTDVKSGYISGRLEQDGSWETHRKNDGFSMLMDNLKIKNEEAVLKYLEEIPEEDIEKFKQDMWWIYEHKNSGLQEDAPVYNRFVREGFNLLTANIADKIRRIERDTGKKLKLV